MNSGLPSSLTTSAPGLGNSVLNLVGVHAENPARPWANFITMQILVLPLLVVVFALLRPRLSMDRPGKFQHIFELIYDFLARTDRRSRGPPRQARTSRFSARCFSSSCSATCSASFRRSNRRPCFRPCRLGCAIAAFLYYNVDGLEGARRRVPEALCRTDPVPGAADVPDRNHQQSGAPALAHHSSFRQHVRGRTW